MTRSRRTSEGIYRLLGYLALLLYALLVIGQALRLYRISSPDWYLLDWMAILFFLSLMPGVPGLLLVVPSKLLETRVATACQFVGGFGILLATVWGFLVSIQWLLLAGLGLLLNIVAYKIRNAQQEII